MSDILEYFELRRVRREPALTGEPLFVTAAVLSCSLCGEMIDGMGGPGDGAVCVRCADIVRSGKARGAIRWDNDPQ